MAVNSKTEKPTKGKPPAKKAESSAKKGEDKMEIVAKMPESPAKKGEDKMEIVAKIPTGFSPVREDVKMAPTDMRDSFWIDTIKGNYFEVILTRAWNQQETENNDAYWPFFTGLAQDGNGFYTWMDKKGKQHTYKCEALIKLGIFYAFIRRKSLAENERMEGDRIDLKNNRRWFCKVVVRVNDKPRTKMERLSTLAHCIDVNKFLNVNVKGFGTAGQYKIGKDLTPEDTNNAKSLDHYLLDDDIKTIMEKHCTGLGPDWVEKNVDMSKWFFDENRSTYPAFAHDWGYVSKFGAKSPGFNDPDDEDAPDSKASDYGSLTATDLAKYF